VKLDNSDQQYGVKIIAEACKVPCVTICDNAGLSGVLIANQLLEQNDEELGVNAQTGEKVNMIQAGIIDPTRVVRTAIVGAVRVSSLMLTTEAMIVEEQKKDEGKKSAAPSGMEDMEY
jgi:chaperonin GroEL